MWEPNSIDVHYWYHATQAMALLGNPQLKQWNKKLTNVVLKSQEQEGDEVGSWSPDLDAWGPVGGRVFMTAMMALVLEAEDRYSL